MRKWAVALTLTIFLALLAPAFGEMGLKSKILVFVPSGCDVCEEQVSLLRQKYDKETSICPLESPTCAAIYNNIYRVLLPQYGYSRHVPFTVVRSNQGLVGAVVLGPLSPEGWDKIISDVEGLNPMQLLLVDTGQNAIVLVELNEDARRAIEEVFTEQPYQSAAPQPVAPPAPLHDAARRGDYFASNLGFLILAVLALAILMYIELGGPKTDKSSDDDVA